MSIALRVEQQIHSVEFQHRPNSYQLEWFLALTSLHVHTRGPSNAGCRQSKIETLKGKEADVMNTP